MASWKELMGRNNFANVERMRGKTLEGIIERVDINENGFKGDKKARFVIDLDSTDMRFTLNLQSCQALGKEFGEDTDDWVGKKVQCKLGKVAFGKNGSVDAILVTPLEKKGRR